MRPELSIAIVLYNSAAELAGCLRSIGPEVRSGWAELILVDNASPDDSTEIARRELPAARILALGENRGFAAGANAALAQASGGYILLLNPDVRVPDGELPSLVRWMDAHPELAAASPEIVGADGHWESPGRALPSIWRALLELSRLHRLLPRSWRGRILRGPYWIGGDQLNAGWVPGTAMIVRRSAVDVAGPLREELFMYGEDIEWCRRFRRTGWRIGVCAETTFVHRTSSSAIRSWGGAEQELRIASGVDAACRVMYGAARARGLAAVTAAGLALEACAPRRAAAQRLRAREAARIWFRVALRR